MSTFGVMHEDIVQHRHVIFIYSIIFYRKTQSFIFTVMFHKRSTFTKFHACEQYLSNKSAALSPRHWNQGSPRTSHSTLSLDPSLDFSVCRFMHVKTVHYISPEIVAYIKQLSLQVVVMVTMHICQVLVLQLF